MHDTISRWQSAQGATRALIAAVLVLAGGCSESLDTPPEPPSAFSLTGGWHVVEKEVNADLLTCTLEYNLTLSQDMAGTISGVSTAHQTASCHALARTAADSALARVDPNWGLTHVTVTPVSVHGYLAERALLLDLGTADWHFSGTQNVDGVQAVVGAAVKNDGILPAGSPWSGTFRMVRLGAGS
jgi:hypothetical protein